MVDVVGDSFAPIGVESGRVVFFCWLVLFDQCAILDGRIWGRLGSLGKLVDRVGEGGNGDTSGSGAWVYPPCDLMSDE
jgi:hypothetical protein